MNMIERLATVGPSLRSLREERDLTLQEVSEQTDISASTLSRLESGKRKATLELLVPLAALYEVALDDVFAPVPGDPRVRTTVHRHGRFLVEHLTNRASSLRAVKITISPSKEKIELMTHEGWDWLYVLDGTLLLKLGEFDVTLGAGETAEFDTRAPHWFGCATNEPVEVLSLFSRDGERMHTKVKAKS